MQILLDSSKKPGNPVFPETGEYHISMLHMLFYSILTMAYFMGCYFLMGEAISRVIASPDYYETIFSNSSGSGETFFVVVLVSIFLHFIFRRMGLLPSKNSKSQNWDLLYYGLGVTATVKEYKDTGTLIDDNPVVKFTYTYPDQRGQIIEGSDKKVVGKLEIVGLPDMHELEIMYLPNNSHISRLTENLQKPGLSNYMSKIILFSLFLFSVFFIVGFCKDLF